VATELEGHLGVPEVDIVTTLDVAICLHPYDYTIRDDTEPVRETFRVRNRPGVFLIPILIMLRPQILILSLHEHDKALLRIISDRSANIIREVYYPFVFRGVNVGRVCLATWLVGVVVTVSKPVVELYVAVIVHFEHGSVLFLFELFGLIARVVSLVCIAACVDVVGTLGLNV